MARVRDRRGADQCGRSALCAARADAAIPASPPAARAAKPREAHRLTPGRLHPSAPALCRRQRHRERRLQRRRRRRRRRRQWQQRALECQHERAAAHAPGHVAAVRGASRLALAGRLRGGSRARGPTKAVADAARRLGRGAAACAHDSARPRARHRLRQRRRRSGRRSAAAHPAVAARAAPVPAAAGVTRARHDALGRDAARAALRRGCARRAAPIVALLRRALSATGRGTRAAGLDEAPSAAARRRRRRDAPIVAAASPPAAAAEHAGAHAGERAGRGGHVAFAVGTGAGHLAAAAADQLRAQRLPSAQQHPKYGADHGHCSGGATGGTRERGCVRINAAAAGRGGGGDAPSARPQQRTARRVGARRGAAARNGARLTAPRRQRGR